MGKEVRKGRETDPALLPESKRLWRRIPTNLGSCKRVSCTYSNGLRRPRSRTRWGPISHYHLNPFQDTTGKSHAYITPHTRSPSTESRGAGRARQFMGAAKSEPITLPKVPAPARRNSSGSQETLQASRESPARVTRRSPERERN